MDYYISLREASLFCHHSQDYLKLRARQGKLRAIKIGRNWVTTKEWLQSYLVGATERPAGQLGAGLALTGLSRLLLPLLIVLIFIFFVSLFIFNYLSSPVYAIDAFIEKVVPARIIEVNF